MNPPSASPVQYPNDVDHLHWSPGEKKVAHSVFDRALTQELDEIMQKVRKMAADLAIPTGLWDLEVYLTKSRRAIDEKYDFRYSQLPLLFGRLVREGRITENDLQGLQEDKLRYVELVAQLRP